MPTESGSERLSNFYSNDLFSPSWRVNVEYGLLIVSVVLLFMACAAMLVAFRAITSIVALFLQ